MQSALKIAIVIESAKAIKKREMHVKSKLSSHVQTHLQNDVFLLFLCEGGPCCIDAGVDVGTGHQHLRSLEKVVLLWVVFEDDAVAVASGPVGETLQYHLVVLQGTLCVRGGWGSSE